MKGNVFVAYAVRAGEAAMVEVALDLFPPDKVSVQVAGTNEL